MYQPTSVVVSDDASQVVYVALRADDDAAIRHVASQGFEPIDGFPGVTFGPEWACFIKRLFTEESA